MVSIGIVAIMGVLISQVFFTTTRSNAKAEVLKNVKQNGDFAAELMGRMIRNANAITTTCADTGSTTTSITLTNPNGGSTAFGCLLDGTVMRIASTSAGRTDYLTDSGLTLGGGGLQRGEFELCLYCPGRPAHDGGHYVSFGAEGHAAGSI